MEYQYFLKIMILGDTAVGKDQLANRFVDNKYEENFTGTIGIDFKIGYINVNDKKFKIQIWMAPMNILAFPWVRSYYGGAQGALLLFNPFNRHSFYVAKIVYNEFITLSSLNSVVVLVSTQYDIKNGKREVSMDEVNAFIEEHGISYIEVSAKENINVYQAFELIVSEIYDQIIIKDKKIHSELNKPVAKEPKKKVKESEIKNLKAELASLQDEMKPKNSQIKKMKFENVALRDSIEIYSRKLEAISKSENEHCQKIKELENELQQLENKNSNQSHSNQNKQLQIFDVGSIDGMEKLKRIGKGASTDVFLVSCEKFYVLKIFKNLKNFKNEKIEQKFYQFLNGLHNQHIVKTYGICFGDDKHQPAILLEYCQSNLKKSIQKLNNIELHSIIFQIVYTMIQVHSSGFSHRNLKPENILLDDENQVKLCDFSGFDDFTSPVIHHEGEKIDILSFGSVLSFIVNRGEKREIKNEITKNLIEKCLSNEPSERPTFKEILKLAKQKQIKLVGES